MKTSLAVQRSTVGDCERRAPSRLREQCFLLAWYGSEGARVGGGSRLSLGGNVGHVLAIFLVRFSTADSSRAFSDSAGVTFPPFFLPSSSYYPSSSSFILHSLHSLLFLLLFLLHSISCSSSPASAIATLRGSKSCLSTRSC